MLLGMKTAWKWISNSFILVIKQDFCLWNMPVRKKITFIGTTWQGRRRLLILFWAGNIYQATAQKPLLLIPVLVFSVPHYCWNQNGPGLLSAARMLWLMMIAQLTMHQFINHASSERNSPLQMGSLITPVASQWLVLSVFLLQSVIQQAEMFLWLHSRQTFTVKAMVGFILHS